MEDRKMGLPQILVDYIDELVRRSGGSRRVRLEVKEELRCHFMDALGGVEGEEGAEESARELIENFGDVKMLGKLINRGKKRCRPMWQKVLFGCLWTLCGLILFFVLYGIWFLTGKPTLSVDYLARLNDMTRPTKAAGENAWPDYEKAIKAYVSTEEVDKGRGIVDQPNEYELPGTVEPPDKKRLATIVGKSFRYSGYRPYSQLGLEEQTAVSEWIDRNEEAWGHYAAGSGKDYSFREYYVGDEEGHPMLLSVLLPHLADIRDLARVGVWRSEKQLNAGQYVEALETCLTVIRSGLHWNLNKGTLIEQLVGQAMIQMGLSQTIVTTASGELSSDEMAKIQGQLRAIFKDGFPEMTVEFERLMFEDCVQHSFTKGGPGGGHIVPKMYSQIAGGGGELEIVGAGLVHAGRDKTLELGNKVYNHMEKVITSSPYALHTGEIESAETILEAHGKWRYSFLWALIPAIERVGQRRYQTKALYDGTLTILAIERWKADKGTLPASLKELKEAGYIAAVPDDPYSAGKLIYAVRDGDFVLYSVGEDFADNGGKQNPEDEWGSREEGGDRVFWPIDSEEWKPVNKGIMPDEELYK